MTDLEKYLTVCKEYYSQFCFLKFQYLYKILGWVEIRLQGFRDLEVTAELRRPSGAHTYIGKKRKPVNGFSHGYHGWRFCL